MPRVNLSIISEEKEDNHSKQNNTTNKRKKESQRKPLIQSKAKKKPRKKSTQGSNIKYYTHDGHPLTPKEALFIDKYMELGNQRQAVIEAGYQTRSPGQYAQSLLTKDYISGEIAHRLKELESASIATATEILQYFTKVMRGEEKDQFGLETPISERTRAAQELAKRQIDMVNRVNGKEVAEVKISLDWSGMEEADEKE